VRFSRKIRGMFSQRAKVICHDLLAITLAWGVAMVARFNFSLPPEPYLTAGLSALPVVLIGQAIVARQFGLYKGMWRFASIPDLWNIIRAAVLGAVIIAIALFVINRLENIPRSIPILYPFFLIFFLGGPRLGYRFWKDHSLSLKNISGGQRVIIIGAGSGGETLIRDMIRDGAYVPVGFVDDRSALTKARIHGIPVLGTIAELPQLVSRYEVESLMIAVPSATNNEMQHIVEHCERSGVPFRTLPKIQDIVSGRVGLQEIRDVSIDDLLGREKIELDWQGIRQAVVAKSILVTGGGGSIGSELCRQIAQLGAANIIVFDKSEFNLYQIESELHAEFPQVPVHCILGDVCDHEGVESLFSLHQPQIVFHAAAYKHVPMLEKAAREAVRNNILGSFEMIEAAHRHNCDSFVLISTDKAVKPSSIMGATKRFAELLCETKNRESTTRYMTVRFGNVLGSTGSVVPLFRKQIRNGGPVTVTHPDATRFFMTIPEACQLILQATAMGQGGEVFVLDMGESINITYLAEQMIRLSGHEPGTDINIVYTGLRPGEKLAEELFRDDENLEQTAHDKLRLANHIRSERREVLYTYEQFKNGVLACDEKSVRATLRSAIPELPEYESNEQGPTILNFKIKPK
jgi:FlaA1/EpsC-like NDP-sugar epimerase